MKKLTNTLAAAALILSAGTVSAETTTESNVENKWEDKAEQILQTLKPSTPKVSGIINGRFTYNEGADPNTSFELRRARLAISGDFGKLLDYKLQAEFASSPKLLDAYLRVKPLKELNIQVGEFKVGYSQETLDGPATWKTINTASVVKHLNGYSSNLGPNSNGRDIGFQLYGGFIHKKGYDIISYKAGLYNGNGINAKDNNSQKDVAALLYVNPIKELTLSAGQYWGHYTLNDVNVKRNRTSAGFTYKDRKLFIRSEYLYGKTGDTSQQGVYATAAYKLPYGLEPVISYDYYQKDTDTRKDNESNYQVGINWQPVKYVRLQLDYTYTKYTNSTKADNNLLETQFLVLF